MAHRLLAASLCASSVLAPLAGKAGAQLIYKNNFETAVGSAWSDAVRDTSNATFTAFKGRHGNDTTTLKLPAVQGNRYKIKFDLYIIDSWDGSSGGFGPDFLQVNSDGATLMFESFDIFNSADRSFPRAPDVSGSNIGFGSFNDEIYRANKIHAGVGSLIFKSVHTTSGKLRYDFFGVGLQGIDDESWGIDNVKVRNLGPAPRASERGTPEPGALAMLGGLLVAGFAWRFRRR